MASTNASAATQPQAPSLAARLSDARQRLGLSLEEVAERLGIRPIVVLRWERGTLAPPAEMVSSILEVLGVETLDAETNAGSIPLLRTDSSETVDERLARLRASGTAPMPMGKETRVVELAPYVVNGPLDQRAFHDALVNLQTTESPLEVDSLARRLSLVASVDGKPTAQFALERPRVNAVSWGSNYGPHGWHRYVGRFPPHLVRALLNMFGADEASLVCDPFAGSGTTLVECRLLGIPAVGVEISPLSALISRTKAGFPASNRLPDVICHLDAFFAEAELSSPRSGALTHEDVLTRTGNPVPAFPNIERWFTPQALLGVSLAAEFASTLDGFERDAVLVALSSKMRSIGNVDVDVVRAEYRKTPRENVDVRALVVRQLQKMSRDVVASLRTHSDLVCDADRITVREGNILETHFAPRSISHIITSPPYGVESLSYFRTHLLSFRSLESFLAQDPYVLGTGVIGSEYLDGGDAAGAQFTRAEQSGSYRQFFEGLGREELSKNDAKRALMMKKFFDDMAGVAERFATWLSPAGCVAFVIGNKKLGHRLIPTADIVTELFANQGLVLEHQLRHKLKTNNSNSVVPWQERIINDEFVLVFRRES